MKKRTLKQDRNRSSKKFRTEQSISDTDKDFPDENQQEVEQEDGNEQESEQEDDEEHAKPLVELLADRNYQLSEIKYKVASLATAVIAAPERNIKKLRDLLSFFDIKNEAEFRLVFLSIQKIVAFAALAVFRDILPGYRLKEKISEEDESQKSKNVRLKKETKRLRDYEKNLIQLYRLYLMRLNRMVECLSRKSKKSNFYDGIQLTMKARLRIAVIGTKCLTDLLITHPNFNFRREIIDMIVPLMTNRHTQIADLCINCVVKVYQSDKLGEVSLETVKSTAKLVKSRYFKVDPEVLRTFLALKIKEIKKDEETNKKDMKKIRSKLNMMSKKEKKRNKKMQKLENQLLETEAEESKERKLKNHTEILNQVFVTYFRILRSNMNNSDEDSKKWFKTILSPVLEGFSKFSNLVNYQFFGDLIGILNRLIQSGQLDDHQCLHSLQTIFIILSGEGSSLNIDPQKAYNNLFGILFNINLFTSDEDIKALLATIDCMICRRKKQMTQQRVLAFIKRLSTIAQETSFNSSVAILSAVYKIMINHKQSDILLDTESSGCGSGVFVPDSDDPEYCNANATLLWELQTLRRHFNPLTCQMANLVLNSSKNSEVLLDILKMTPLETFEKIDSNDFNLSLNDYRKGLLHKSSKSDLTRKEKSVASQALELLCEKT